MICPSCGETMQERACHVTCRRCGYFEDCSDGMLPVLASQALQERTPGQSSAPSRAAPKAKL